MMAATSLQTHAPNRTWQVILLLAIVGIVYWNSLTGPFHYDDEHSIVRNQALRSLTQIPGYFTDLAAFSGDEGKGMYRPLLLVTYAVNHALHGYEVLGFHLVNIALHAICTMLVWRLGRLLSPNHVHGAWMAAAVFAVHPVAAEPVNYISSRSELLMAVFFLLALLLYLQQGKGHGCDWAAPISFALALLSKETAIVLIVVLMLFDVWGRSGVRDLSVGAMARRHGPYWVIAGAYLTILFWVGFLGNSGSESVRDPLQQVFTQVKAIVYYLQLLIMPSLLSVDHAFRVSSELTATVAMAAVFAMSGTLFALRGHLHTPRVALGLGACVCVLLPTSIVPLNVLVNERRIYLVLALVCILLPRIMRLRGRPALITGLVLLAGLTNQRNEVWASPVTLWENATDQGSRSYTAFVNLGKARQSAGDVIGATRAYRQALTINDGQGDVYNNVAVLLHESGQLQEAIVHYEKALERSPGMEEIHHNLAVAQQQTGDLAAAAVTFRRALELDPRNGGLWSNYGQLLLQLEDASGAESAYREAIRLLGDRPEPHNSLGNALSRQGRRSETIESYERALSYVVGSSQRSVILINLGESLMMDLQPARARQVLREALDITASAAAHDYLGRLSFADADTAGAWGAWQAAIQLDATRRVPLTGLGEIAAARGEIDTAVALLERAVAAGGGRRAQEGLRRVRLMRGQAER